MDDKYRNRIADELRNCVKGTINRIMQNDRICGGEKMVLIIMSV